MRHTTIHAVIPGILLASPLIDPAHAQTPNGDASRASAPDTYRIGPEDVLLVSVWKNTSLTQQVIVRPDGKISLPLLNDVQAAGLTPNELRELLSTKLANYMPDRKSVV